MTRRDGLEQRSLMSGGGGQPQITFSYTGGDGNTTATSPTPIKDAIGGLVTVGALAPAPYFITSFNVSIPAGDAVDQWEFDSSVGKSTPTTGKSDTFTVAQQKPSDSYAFGWNGSTAERFVTITATAQDANGHTVSGSWSYDVKMEAPTVSAQKPLTVNGGALKFAESKNPAQIGFSLAQPAVPSATVTAPPDFGGQFGFIDLEKINDSLTLQLSTTYGDTTFVPYDGGSGGYDLDVQASNSGPWLGAWTTTVANAATAGILNAAVNVNPQLWATSQNFAFNNRTGPLVVKMTIDRSFKTGLAYEPRTKSGLGLPIILQEADWTVNASASFFNYQLGEITKGTYLDPNGWNVSSSGGTVPLYDAGTISFSQGVTATPLELPAWSSSLPIGFSKSGWNTSTYVFIR